MRVLTWQRRLQEAEARCERLEEEAAALAAGSVGVVALGEVHAHKVGALLPIIVRGATASEQHIQRRYADRGFEAQIGAYDVLLRGPSR